MVQIFWEVNSEWITLSKRCAEYDSFINVFRNHCTKTARGEMVYSIFCIRISKERLSRSCNAACKGQQLQRDGTDTDEDAFCLCDVCYLALIPLSYRLYIIHLQRLPLSLPKRIVYAKAPCRSCRIGFSSRSKNGFFLWQIQQNGLNSPAA